MTFQRSARFGFALLAALALSGAPSRADDSIATLGAGGLALEKTDKIALVAEDLYLSPTAVKVSYRFRNLTNADYETIVAFPMPDVTGSLVVDKGDPQTLVSFCGDGVKKIGPTTFEMIAKDYMPKRDIDVLFIETH